MATTLERALRVLHGCKPHDEDALIAVSFLLGAGYALREAGEQFEYPADMSPALRSRRNAETAGALVDGRTPPMRWLRGFYFNDAVLRLHMAGEVLGVLKYRKPGDDPLVLAPVRADSIRIKHTRREPRRITTTKQAAAMLLELANIARPRR